MTKELEEGIKKYLKEIEYIIHDDGTWQGLYLAHVRAGRLFQKVLDENAQGVEDFTVVTVCREDLEYKGYDTTNINDETMKCLASKMGSAYLDDGFWIDMEICADSLCIPRKEE